jgi:hypothetical protein
MKELNGTASATVSAPIDRCFDLLLDLEHYPRWYPDVVREAAVTERDAQGQPVSARTTLHVAVGPLVHDFNLTLSVRSERPRSVQLARVPHRPSDREQFDVNWSLLERSGTQIEVVLKANLSVPRLVPVGGVGDRLARGFVDAAVRALR